MIDLDQAISYYERAEEIRNDRVRKIREAQQSFQETMPKIRNVEPEGRYTITPLQAQEIARENQKTLHELTQVEEWLIAKATKIGVNMEEVEKVVEGRIQKLRESSYLEFAQLPKLTAVPATTPATNGDTFLTRTYPKLSEKEEHALDEAFSYVEGFNEYVKLNPIDDLLNKDKLTNTEFERINTHRRYCVTAEKAMKVIAELSAKKYR